MILRLSFCLANALNTPSSGKTLKRFGGVTALHAPQRPLRRVCHERSASLAKALIPRITGQEHFCGVIRVTVERLRFHAAGGVDHPLGGPPKNRK